MTAEILAPTHALPCIEKLVYQYPSVVIHSDHLEVVKFLNTGEMNPTLRRTHPDLILHFQALDKSAKPYKGRLKAVLSVRTEEQVKSSPIRSKAANQRINPIASQTFTPDVFM